MDKTKKAKRYERVFLQLSGLLDKPGNRLSKMATIAAVLHHKMDHFFWTGFYLANKDTLTAGPYQGPVACQTLDKDQGVCWAAVNRGESIIVRDVHRFPGHIACDGRSNSEIVVPLKDGTGSVTAVLDIDSRDFDAFDEIDRHGLESILSLLDK